MTKRFVGPMFVLLAGASTLAYADGEIDEYDHGETAVARTLSPNEYLVNADGMQEDAKHRMSDVARAYRNGLIAGRKEADAKRQAVELPPLPAHTQVAEVDVDADADSPPLAQPRPRHVERRVAPEQQYVEYQAAPPVQQRPMQYVAQQNVYTSAPYASEEAEDDESYAPRPPVYVRPAHYVYVQPPQRVWVAPPPMDYSGRGYGGPVETIQRPYAYQPYY